MELLSKLGIDWKLLIAQVINFAILFFVLYKFAYKPVLQMLETRTKMIERGVHDAKAAEENLKKAEELRDKKIRDAEKEVGRLIENAKKDAEQMSAQLVASAQKQSEELLKRSQLQIQEQKEAMMSELRRDVTSIVVTATSRLLKREFSPADQKRLMDALSKEMESI